MSWLAWTKSRRAVFARAAPTLNTFNNEKHATHRLHRQGQSRVGWSRSLQDDTQMILAFDSEELRTTCEDADAARSQVGENVAAALRVRIADLRAIDSIDDLLVGRAAPKGESSDVLEVELVAGVVMTFVPNHNRPRVTDAGAVDWTRVRRIRLTRIGDPS
jgi:hypothetical protein